MLVRHFVEANAREANLRPRQFTDEALERCSAWTGPATCASCATRWSAC